MKRFLWVSILSLALIAITAATPDDAFSSVTGLPLHPLLVHVIVVLIPLLSLFVIVGLFRVTLLQKSYLFVIGGFGVLAAGAIAAKKSGEQLAEVVGLPEQHEQLGTILIPLALGLFVSFALFALCAFVIDKRGLAIVLAVLVGLQAGASIPLTIMVGHSGAESVWGGVVVEDETAESAADELAEGVAEESQATTAPVPSDVAMEITRDEVALHSTPEDCWTIVNGEVYDLTPFVGRHPGGRTAISQICGGDGTELFTGQHAGQGSPERELSSLKIGVLK